MNWLIGTGAFVCLVASILYFTEAGRYAKTFLLINRVEPYRQTGSGAGTILFIGDSTGYGTGASKSTESVAGRVGTEFPSYAIENNSVNGRKIEGAHEVVSGVDERYDLIILQIGANDLLAKRPVSEVVEDMAMLIHDAQNQADEVVVLTSGNIGGVPSFSGEEEKFYETISREYDALMKLRFAENELVTFVSLFDEPSDDPFVAEPDTYTSSDGLHPTSAGYNIWYQKALPHIRQALEK